MSEWISIYDQEPNLDERVLLCFESGEIATGWRDKINDDNIYYGIGHPSNGWDYEFNYDYGGIVTHWMPLPTPPNK